MRSLRARVIHIASLFGRGRPECELAEKVKFQLQGHIEDGLRSRMILEEARRHRTHLKSPAPYHVLLAVALLSPAFAWAASPPTPVPCEVLVPVLDAQQAVVTATAPDGKTYPVFRRAPQSPLLDQVHAQLTTSFAQQVLKLDRYARNLLISKAMQSDIRGDDMVHAPMYLLMSTEEGGFARFGFWLEEAHGKRQLLYRRYVDLVVDERSVRTGGFEEIFSHELGHLILRVLASGLPDGVSRKMHQSMSVTDYPTAFDEGYAEHFQPLVRDATTNPYLRKLAGGTRPTDLEMLWLSAADGQLRTEGVKHNLFIHRKPVPALGLDPQPDLYRLFVESETSIAFLPTELKNGQEMMASEGVIATLFYRLVNDETLRNSYRDPSFYEAFLPAPVSRPQQIITPYENVNLKLFAAMEQVRHWTADRPPVLSVIEQYAKLFPDEAKRVYQLFVETTWGAVTSQELASALERASAAGHRGDISAFRNDRPFPLLNSIVAEVAAGKRPLDANLGPELWIVNPDFKIAPAYWEAQRTEPLTMNLNTASIPELMTIPGIDLALARKIILARDAHGYFGSLEDLAGAGVGPAVMEHLRGMQKAMKSTGPYKRQ